MAVSELACIYSALILHDDEVTVTALNNVNIASLICNVGVGGPAPAACGAAPAGGAAPASTAASAEEKKKEEAKKEESEESDDDMGFGLFD
ncbi:60S acidic ribosomal protein P1-like isoform X2 [Dromiciops gliroides]|uniref:60S acidic ribosomal protein P1-like isoform X2 n=1 Tax=Dromiciops gliroides TaxID=33562 RepID=UPI001CC33525|nr:60S acidic ribosomal protein P1-like isoform X2 [Dromiciops gliroides]